MVRYEKLGRRLVTQDLNRDPGIVEAATRLRCESLTPGG